MPVNEACDDHGVELHCVDQFLQCRRLIFLPPEIGQASRVCKVRQVGQVVHIVLVVLAHGLHCNSHRLHKYTSLVVNCAPHQISWLQGFIIGMLHLQQGLNCSCTYSVSIKVLQYRQDAKFRGSHKEARDIVGAEAEVVEVEERAAGVCIVQGQQQLAHLQRRRVQAPPAQQLRPSGWFTRSFRIEKQGHAETVDSVAYEIYANVSPKNRSFKSTIRVSHLQRGASDISEALHWTLLLTA